MRDTGAGRRLTTALGVVLAWSILIAATGAQASKSRNAAVLARVLSFELTLEGRAGASVGVAVIYKRGDKASEANAAEWLQALNELSSVKIKDRSFFAVKVAFGAGELAAAIDRQGVDVLLVSDGLAAESSAIAQIARSKHVLTAANTLDYVQKDLTLCVTEQGDKTKIIVNLTSAQLEGIRFSSNLLKLATVIR